MDPSSWSRLLRSRARSDGTWFGIFEAAAAIHRSAHPPDVPLALEAVREAAGRRLLVHDRDAVRASLWAEQLGRSLERAGQGKLVLSGPGPAPIERLKGVWRQQILVRTAGRRRLVRAVDDALEAAFETIPRRAVHVDVDPLSVL